ncbi:hypothetical protein [Nonomuraea sp. CA-141351]|uniref:hypothetical protein n=1 Tax=Nonomuraea sp. CA-141351 TaxID=3239996 RepID=UPI003D8E2FCE
MPGGGQPRPRLRRAPALDILPSWLTSRPEQAAVSAWLSYSTSLPVLAGPLLGSAALAAWGARITLLLAALALAMVAGRRRRRL